MKKHSFVVFAVIAIFFFGCSRVEVNSELESVAGYNHEYSNQGAADPNGLAYIAEISEGKSTRFTSTSLPIQTRPFSSVPELDADYAERITPGQPSRKLDPLLERKLSEVNFDEQEKAFERVLITFEDSLRIPAFPN